MSCSGKGARTEDKFLAFVWLVWACIAIPTVANAQSQHRYSVSDYLSLEQIGRGTADPTGRWIAWEQAPPYGTLSDFGLMARGAWEGSGYRLYAVDLTRPHSQPQELFPGAARDSCWLASFSPNGRYLVFYVASSGHFRVGVVDMEERRVRILPITPKSTWDRFYGVLWFSNSDFVVSAISNGTEPLISARGFAGRQLWGRWNAAWAGHTVSASQTDSRPIPSQDNGQLVRVNARTGTKQVIAAGNYVALAISPDGRYLLGRREPGEGEDIGDPSQNSIVFDLAHDARVDNSSDTTRWRAIEAMRPSEAVDFTFTAVDGSSTTISAPRLGARLLAGSAGQAAALFRSDAPDGGTIWLSYADGRNVSLVQYNRHLGGLIATEWTSFQYSAHSPLQTSHVEGCLLLPPDFQTGRRYPVIVEIYPHSHGICSLASGKQMMGRMTGPYNDHLFAAMGFIVFRPNTSLELTGRDPKPFGEVVEAADQAVDALVAAGLADRERIGLLGFSQGGFVSLDVATRSNRFRAIVSINGWSDMYSEYFGGLRSPLYDVHNVPFDSERSRYENPISGFGESPWATPSSYVQGSPLFRAQRIQVPVLLIHSDMDGFSLGQYEMMFSALMYLRKPARLIRYWGEGHGPSSPANIQHMLANIFSWYDEYLDIERSPSGDIVWADNRAAPRIEASPPAPD